MVDFFLRVLWETWNIFKQASIFPAVRLLLAGVLAVVVPGEGAVEAVPEGQDQISAVGRRLSVRHYPCVRAESPAALGLRRQGATPGATAAFLIATPETGVDSISLSYALTDLTTTIFRPVAAR